MTKYSKLSSIFLLIVLLSQSVFIDARAFFNCKRNQCTQKAQFQSLGNLDIPIDLDSSSPEPDPLGPLVPVLPNQYSNNNSNTNSSPISPSSNNSNSGQSKTCSANLSAFSAKKAIAQCQIQTAILKAKNITFFISVLQGALSKLLRLMKKAPVCTDAGYTVDEYNKNHSIANNLANLKSLVQSFLDLEERLKKITFACADCDDETALTSALASIDSILEELAELIADFNNELDEINQRLEDFISRITQVISAHGVSVEAIMYECGVNPFIARKMRRARLRALDAFLKFVAKKDEIFKQIADENLGTHDCKLSNDDLEITVVCNDLTI